MCGIAGYREFHGSGEHWALELPAAVKALAHRGPDDQGTWIGANGAIGLGHRRLSILDLSMHGHQPMASTCGQWQMVFNGEIYNFKSIRAELEPLGHRFAGTGDSEIILAAFAQWGLDAVSRFIGMFAIALWHHPTQQLHLLRDRLGVKPLYYHWDGKRLFFGSELKAVRAFTGWKGQIDNRALCDYLRYGYINAPLTIYQHVFKLPPAHRLSLDAAGNLELLRYWRVTDHVGLRSAKGEAELEEELEALMISAFKYRMIADVPVGVFLSGGVDSSMLSAILQQHSNQRIKTFTIGFDVPDFDESPFAADVAGHLGTEHYSRILRVEDAKRLLLRWGDLYDEPFGDESGIPTLLVSQFAAEQVKVVLSADGGDELFCGYNNYSWAIRRWQGIQGMPHRLRKIASAAISGVNIDGLDNYLAANPNSAVQSLRNKFSLPLSRFGRRVGVSSIGALFDNLLEHSNLDDISRLIGSSSPTRELGDVYPGNAGEKLCLWDLHNFLPGDILTKVDRATMAVSIEGREPFLDHRLAEFAFSLPFDLRQGRLGGKHLLKKVLYRYVPRSLVDRPKRGFAVPVTKWLTGDLADLVSDHLDGHQLATQGLFDPGVVNGYLKRLRAGDETVCRRIWEILAFQMWFRRWM